MKLTLPHVDVFS